MVIFRFPQIFREEFFVVNVIVSKDTKKFEVTNCDFKKGEVPADLSPERWA